ISAFEQTLLPHLDAAYNLARWLMENDLDAEDAVQEAYLRAFRFFGGFRGGNSRAWLLTIVRNTCYTLQRQTSAHRQTRSFDEEMHGGGMNDADPETILLKNLDSAMLKNALERLPTEFREALVLRELEGFTYKEISDATDVPLGTVMSRLARARTQLRLLL